VKAFVINIKHRTDRWQDVSFELQKQNIEFERFDAVYFEDNGRLGLIKTYEKLFTKAINENMKAIVVMEDDVKFEYSPNDVIDKVKEQLPTDFDILYLSGTPVEQCTWFSDNLNLIKRCYGLMAVIFSNKVFKEIRDHCQKQNTSESEKDAIDVWIADNIQPRKKCFLVTPFMASQKESYSDITKLNINYKIIKILYEKFTVIKEPKVVACYCVWGDKDTGVVKKMYLRGLAENMKIASKYGWKNHVAIEKDLPGTPGYFWRFASYDTEQQYDYFVFRDTDSRISEREVLAVKEWIKSGKTLHIMRDHPHHNHTILGGMWGLKRVKGLNMSNLIRKWLKENYDKYPEYHNRPDKPKGWMLDMFFLKDVIYPMFKNDCLQHDEFFTSYGDTIPFPIKRNNLEFVGEIIGEDGTPCEYHRNILKEYLKTL